MEKEKKTAVERIRGAIENLDFEIEIALGRLRRCTQRLSKAAQEANEALPWVFKGETTHKSSFTYPVPLANDLDEAYRNLENLIDLKKSMENLLQDES